MTDRGERRRAAFALAAALALAGIVLARPIPRTQDQVLPAPQTEQAVVVPAASGWVDTGIDVGPAEELVFRASGEVSLQKGNPEAVCGPGGLDLVTVEQPVPQANLGALIGRIAQLVASRIDEDSGLEIRDEVFVLFLVGPESAVSVPFKGRLYLGVNENVVKDNGGEFSVLVTRRPI
jgi:hypothetical protein